MEFITKIAAAKINQGSYLRVTVPKHYANRRIGVFGYGSTLTLTPDDPDGVKVSQTKHGDMVYYSIQVSPKRYRGLVGTPSGKGSYGVTTKPSGEFSVDIADLLTLPSAMTQTPAKITSISGTLVSSKDNVIKSLALLNKYASEHGFQFIVNNGKLTMERVEVLAA